MKITFLGTGATCPDLLNATSLAVQPKNHQGYLLVDTGWGGSIFRELKDCGYNPQDLEAVFLSHIHMDHSLGLPLLYSRLGNIKKVLYTDQKLCDVLTSKNIWEMIETIIYSTGSIEREPIRKNLPLVGISHKNIIRNAYGFESLEFFKTRHEKKKPGRLPTESYGIIIRAEGKKVVYPSDTVPLPITVEKARQADLLIHEVFCPIDSKLAEKSGHFPAIDVGKIAQSARVKKLVLTHFVAEFITQQEKMKEAAQRYFKGEIILSEDHLSLEI
ncbi:hypothetical protein CO181_02435 [candidate division WWE3 bacterium CG_4_9_14_3_um_filter_43_9]|uniref:Metallo-beta-lactamase domain-containing protein n=2 Tax=Katanobacteria TaxID=422282 RepID=A0A2M7WXC1_UNCKA|nr:MAG: hypothetical protein CO181_02435 [candidate division WWE3 bacterium CG_4_9_14_3_um_filter_43_9]